jgi:arginine decarboxylase
MYGPLFAIARKKRVSHDIFDDARSPSRRRLDARRRRFSLAFNVWPAIVGNDFSARTGCAAARADRRSREPARDTMGGEKEERMTKKVTLAAATAGHAEGGTALNAFDNALLAAGIGNINLIKVSSILPPEVPVVELPKIKPGALIPTAYAAMTSEVPGETVAAAVGYAVPDDPAKNGVIMEFHGHASRMEAERQIERMLEEAFRVRGEPIREMKIVAVEHTVERIGCALAAIALLAEEDLL